MAKIATRCAESLFKNAENGGTQFVYSLVRVKGIESFEQDELSKQMEKVKKYKSKILKCNDKSEIIEILTELYKQKEIFRIIANLINCSKKNFINMSHF